MVTATADLNAKTCTLDRRIAAGETLEVTFPGLWADWGGTGTRLRLASADGSAALAESDRPASDGEGGLRFTLDLDTEEAPLAATAGRAETPALLILERVADGGRRLLVRQQLSVLGWPRSPDDTPSGIPQTYAGRIAALEAAVAALPATPAYPLAGPTDICAGDAIRPRNWAVNGYANRSAAACALALDLAAPSEDAIDLVLDIDNDTPDDLAITPDGSVAWLYAGGAMPEGFWTVPSASAVRYLLAEAAVAALAGSRAIAADRLTLREGA